MRRKKGFTLVELIMTIAIVGVMAGAFVSLFVPQLQLFLYLPTNLRVQEASSLLMEAMVNGKMTVVDIGGTRRATFVPGLKYAEPATATGKLVNLTGITYADPDEVQYTYFDAKRGMYTVRIFLNLTSNSIVRLVDTEVQSDLKVISSNGARGTGGVRIRTGENNGAGVASIFRYYRQDGTEMTGVLTAANRNDINRIDIAFVADTGGGAISNYQASVVKRTSVSIKRRFFPEPGEWEFQFADRNGDARPDLFAIKKHDGGTAAGSADTELHVYNGPNFGVENFNANIGSGESGDHFDFLVVDCDGTGHAGLVRIQKILAGNVQLFDGCNGSGVIGSAAPTGPLPDGVDTYKFGMALYRANGAAAPDATQDLFVALVVKGKTRVQVYSGDSVYTNWFSSTGNGYFVTSMATINATTNLWSDWDFFFVNWNPPPAVPNDNYVDMVAIHKKRTSSGFVEIIIFDGQARKSATGALLSTGKFRFGKTLPGPARTIIPAITGNNLDFKIADWNNDGTPDLFCVQRNQTTSGSTVVRVLSGIPDGSNILSNILLQTDTAMPEVDSGKSLP